MYSFDARVRFSETDDSGRLTPFGVLNYFQDCSTFQSEDLGVGLKPLKEMGYYWVLNYWQIDIYRMPLLCERIRVGTIPYSVKGFLGFRNFFMEDEGGQRLAAANSIWCLLSLKNGKPAHIPDQILKAYGEEPRLPMEYEPRKIRPEEKDIAQRGESFEVRQIHLDANHHVNNGQFVRMALDCLSADIPISRIRVEYRKAAYLGDTVYPVVYKTQDCRTVSLNGEDGKPYAVVELKCLN